MTDYTKLVAALQNNDWSDACPCCDEAMCKDADCIIFQAADAIEALQAELERKRTADCFGCKCEKLEPKRGEWELIDGAEPMRWGCSRCKYMSWDTPNYCPRCGAKMEVQDESAGSL